MYFKETGRKTVQKNLGVLNTYKSWEKKYSQKKCLMKTYSMKIFMLCILSSIYRLQYSIILKKK